MITTTNQLITAYEALLMISTNDSWRATHQEIYAALRDAIAKHTYCRPEFIQTTFEAASILRQY